MFTGPAGEISTPTIWILKPRPNLWHHGRCLVFIRYSTVMEKQSSGWGFYFWIQRHNEAMAENNQFPGFERNII